jgi:hypothetical protein
VRPSTQSNLPALADEIARLSKENAELRGQLATGIQEEKINGLTFLELKAVLENLDLLDFFNKNKSQFAEAFPYHDPTTRSKVLELIARGLVERKNTMYVGLTDGGRAFLNKLEALQLTEKRK